MFDLLFAHSEDDQTSKGKGDKSSKKAPKDDEDDVSEEGKTDDKKQKGKKTKKTKGEEQDDEIKEEDSKENEDGEDGKTTDEPKVRKEKSFDLGNVASGSNVPSNLFFYFFSEEFIIKKMKFSFHWHIRM